MWKRSIVILGIISARRVLWTTVIVFTVLLIPEQVESFVSTTNASSRTATETQLFAQNSKLPPGISPFEKSKAKGLDIQGSFRKIASKAIDTALRNGVTQLEVDFPPFVGGDQSKTQFDDYDNLQELNANRDWCVQLAPTLATSNIWLILPDDKECELAKKYH